MVKCRPIFELDLQHILSSYIHSFNVVFLLFKNQFLNLEKAK